MIYIKDHIRLVFVMERRRVRRLHRAMAQKQKITL
jgi:hypothetical protein